MGRSAKSQRGDRRRSQSLLRESEGKQQGESIIKHWRNKIVLQLIRVEKGGKEMEVEKVRG